MINYPEFKELVARRYVTVFESAITNYLNENYGDVVDSLISSSFMNSKRWNRGETDIRVDADNMYSWIEDRKNFMYDYMLGEEKFYEISFEFSWGTLPYYIRKGEALEFLPLEEYGEVTYQRDGAEEGKNIVSWKNKNGETIEVGYVPNENVNLIAIYDSAE